MIEKVILTKYKTDDKCTFHTVEDAARHLIVNRDDFSDILDFIYNGIMRIHNTESVHMRRVQSLHILLNHFPEIVEMNDAYTKELASFTPTPQLNPVEVRDALENAWNKGHTHLHLLTDNASRSRMIQDREDDVNKIMSERFGIPNDKQ